MLNLTGLLLEKYQAVDRLELVHSREKKSTNIQSDRVMTSFMDNNLLVEVKVNDTDTIYNVYKDYGVSNKVDQTFTISNTKAVDIIVANGDTLVVLLNDGSLNFFTLDSETNLLNSTPTTAGKFITMIKSHMNI